MRKRSNRAQMHWWCATCPNALQLVRIVLESPALLSSPRGGRNHREMGKLNPGDFSLPASCLFTLPSRLLTLHGLGEAVTFSGKDHDVGVMNKPVNKRRRQAIITENRVPAAKFEIRGYDEALSLIAIRNHLKQQFRSIPVKRNEADLVYDHELHTLKRGHGGGQRSLLVLFQQYVSQRCRREKACPLALFAGLERKACGQVRFTRSDRS